MKKNNINEKCFWDEIKGLGKLYVDIELVVANEPILCVCVQENTNKKYLIMTYDSYNGVYILCKITDLELLNMLENRVTMEKTFRNGKAILKTCVDKDNLLHFENFDVNTFPEEMLPKKGAYFELQSKHILDYIKRLRNLV